MAKRFDSVREHVLNTARERAADILSAAAAQCAAIRAETEEHIASLEADRALERDRETALIQQRSQSRQTMERRRLDLEARQRLVERVLQAARERLITISDAERQTWYIQELLVYAKPGWQIRFRPADSHLAPAVLAALPQAPERLPDDPELEDGFVLSRGRVEERHSLTGRLDEERERWVEEIGRRLFAERKEERKEA
ncbi:MAG: V-type ATP synthase subunit E family protein [Bacillota bacterium]|nr:V-type ATP synthase subunit E family protein [Bacillota bacterium]